MSILAVTEPIGEVLDIRVSDIETPAAGLRLRLGLGLGQDVHSVPDGRAH